MSISFDLPGSIESLLRTQFGDLNQVAKESALVEFYRQQKLSHHELAIALGLGRLETEALLKRHNVTEDSVTSTELQDQAVYLHKLTDK